MKLTTLLLSLGLCFATNTSADGDKKESLSKKEVQRLLDIFRNEKGPSIYAAIYYPKWQKPLDGLKSVTAEAIAENAKKVIAGGVTFTVMQEPVTDGDVAGVILKRSGGAMDEGLFPVFLYRDGENSWGFLGLPAAFKAPALLGHDGQFMEQALNDPSPYDGVLYEFDKSTITKFEEMLRKLEHSIKQEKENAAPQTEGSFYVFSGRIFISGRHP